MEGQIDNDSAIQSVPITIQFSKRSIECVGPYFFQYLAESKEHDSAHTYKNEEEEEKLEEDSVVFEDDVEYLRSLDPKEWKEQDHYAVLGIKKLRYKATDDIIKRAYRQKVLRHHPDKRKGQGEEVRSDDDYFTCITKAYEILGTPLKRRSYDSVDPEFDDALPSANDLKRDFYKYCNKYFDLNARWSDKKHVPKIGNDETSRQQVEKFYSFWYNFDSWREYSYNDEEEKEKGQDREERRWIEKQNKAVRAKRKKEEMTRIRTLVDLAYNNDPRIARFKQEEKDRKLAAKRAKQDAVQARKDEEERVLKEAQLAKEKAEAAERSRIDAIRSEREAQKRALKKERKTLRDTCKSNEYYTKSADELVEHMSAVEKICEMLKVTEIAELNKDLKSGGRGVFLKTMKETNEKLEAERRAMFEPNVKATIQVKPTISSGQIDWTPDNIQLLIKAVNLFPAGTVQRWEVIANFINQHAVSETPTKVSAKDVLNKAKSLQNADFSKSVLKTAANEAAFDSFEKDKKNARVVDNTSISVASDSKAQVNGVPKQNGTAPKKSNSKTDVTKNKSRNNNATEVSENNVKNKKKDQVKKEDSPEKSIEKEVVQNGTSENHNSKNESEKKSDKVEAGVPWSKTEQALLEQAIKTYPVNTPERWERISECIPNRSKKDCMRRFKELVDMVKAKKQARQLDSN